MSIVVVTGASAGLGLHCAAALCADARVAAVVLAVRRADAARAALVSLAGASAAKAVTLDAPLDLASLSSVRAYARALRGWLAGRAVHALVLNAGVGGAPGLAPALTCDGFERIWQTNHLGHALLALLLLPALCGGGEDARAPRLVLVSSEVHDARAAGVPPASIPDPEDGWPADAAAAGWEATLARGGALPGESAGAAGGRRYSQSKLCNVLFCHELARRLAGAAPRGAPAEAAAAAAAAPGAASCTLPGARRLRVVAMNPGLMLDSNFTAGVVGPFLGSTAGAAIGAIAWGLSPLLRFVPAVGKLLRSAQQSGPILAAIALPAAPGPADDNAAYYDGAEVKPASAFSRSAACAAGHQQELFRRTLAWAQLSDAELADAGFPLAARRE